MSSQEYALEIARQVAAAVDPERVQARLTALAQPGADPNGGISCLAFSDAEMVANALFISWLRAAGLTVACDAVGNIFGSTDGNHPNAHPLAAGSHLDTVPNGGKYDGRLGLVAALETIEALRSLRLTPPIPLEVIAWRCEEPSRFPAGRIGSQVFSVEQSLEDLLATGSAFAIGDYLALDLPLRAAERPLAGYLELHIEQGKRLEDAGVQIGVVSGIAGATRIQVTITGTADHSGATPMGLRRDALCAAAELILAVEQAGLARREQNIVATTGKISVQPGALNVVPGGAELWLDVRGTDTGQIAATLDEITSAGEQIAERRQVTVQFTQTAAGVPIAFPEDVVRSIEETAQMLGYSAMVLPSGAGHDAQTIAPLAPSGMIFVPSVGGISHAPQEYSTPEAVEHGVRTFAAEWTKQIFSMEKG